MELLYGSSADGQLLPETVNNLPGRTTGSGEKCNSLNSIILLAFPEKKKQTLNVKNNFLNYETVHDIVSLSCIISQLWPTITCFYETCFLSFLEYIPLRSVRPWIPLGDQCIAELLRYFLSQKAVYKMKQLLYNTIEWKGLWFICSSVASPEHVFGHTQLISRICPDIPPSFSHVKCDTVFGTLHNRYPHMPTDCRHTDKLLGLVMRGQTDGVCIIPASRF